MSMVVWSSAAAYGIEKRTRWTTSHVDAPALRLIREWIAGMKSPKPEETKAALK